MKRGITQHNYNNWQETFWEPLLRLKGSLETRTYKSLVMRLIFLKFASGKLEAFRTRMTEKPLEDISGPDFCRENDLVYLPETLAWVNTRKRLQKDITYLGHALKEIVRMNAWLQIGLSDDYFSSISLNDGDLTELIDLVDQLGDIAVSDYGRVYGCIIEKFIAFEGKRIGHYTPSCLIDLITLMAKPDQGSVYDPCCGDGRLLAKAAQCSLGPISAQRKFYGQTNERDDYQLSQMIGALHGYQFDLGSGPADIFFEDQHPDLSADFVMAIPPFNSRNWRAPGQWKQDVRWVGYAVPPVNNANYAWILHIVSKLSEQGTACFILPQGSMYSNTSSERRIREGLIENDLIDCIIALPSRLFQSSPIPVCVWLLSKSKVANVQRGARNRKGETLFMDAQGFGAMTGQRREINEKDIAAIAQTYLNWRCDQSGEYDDQASFCKSVTLQELRDHNYLLTPNIYIEQLGSDPPISMEENISTLITTLQQQIEEAAELDAHIIEKMRHLSLGHDK